MAQTKSEKLLKQIGKPVQCDICHKKILFGNNWLMTSKKMVVCPKCQDGVAKKGELLVSI
ncbi:hypothetical protein ACFLW5_02395 [Chloroflexota bacterium]